MYDRYHSEAVDKRAAACACVSSMAEMGASPFARSVLGPKRAPAVKFAIATLEKNCLTYHAESVRQNAIEVTDSRERCLFVYMYCSPM